MKKCLTVLFVPFIVLAFGFTSFAATIKKVDEPAVKLKPGEAATKPVDKANQTQKAQQPKDKKVSPVKPNDATKAKDASWDWGNKK